MKGSLPGKRRSAAMHVFRGSAWMIALRWAVRLIGVVSTVILARLLTPADFGVVSIAMIVVGMLEILGQTGQSLAIIRHSNPTDDHYDAAWTLSAMSGFMIAAAIIAIAPLTKVYFHEPRAVVVIQSLGLRAALQGLENIGTVNFNREFQFSRVFQLNVYSKIFSFLVTVGLAVALRNYWALVAGILSAQFARTVFSYVMHPYRPRFSFLKIPEIWSFSLWTFVRTIGAYLIGQVDRIAVGGIAGASSMGRYAVASDVSSSPSEEIIQPMSTALYPVMARLQGDHDQLRQLYLRTLAWSAIICASTGVGIALVAREFVHLVLGPKWMDVVPLMGWLALDAALMGLRGGAYTVLDAIGLPHVGARMQWFRLLVIAVAVFPAAYLTHDLVVIAQTRFVATIIFIPNLFFAVGRNIGVTPRHYLRALWRPFTAVGVMAAVVLLMNRTLPLAGNLKLVIDVAIGAGTYVGTILSLWAASGKPAAPERDLLTSIERIRAKLSEARRTAPAQLARSTVEGPSPGLDA